MQRPRALSGLSPQSFTLKNDLYFFLKKPALKKFLIFSSNRTFSYYGKWKPRKKSLIFQETETLKSFLYFGESDFSVHPEKLYYTSGNGNPEKISYIFSKESFYYISGNDNPPKILIFQETETLKNFLYFRK